MRGPATLRLVAVLGALSVAGVSQAQTRAMLLGAVDAELWDTDTSSNLLSRNAGRASTLGRLTLWGAMQPHPRLVLYGLAESQFGSAVDSAHHRVEQAAIRYTISSRAVLDAGKITMPLGTFSARRFSWRNPLIGTPDAYPVLYPYGVTVSGAAASLDYRAGVVSLPMTHEDYSPAPSHAARPVIGIGITPFIGVRLGLGYTWGPYLNDTLTSTQLDGRKWSSYQQRVLVADLAASYGYFELFAEAGASAYDVPRTAEPVEGLAYFVEGKYTFTPRVFVALRLERNDYPFIRPVSPTFWVARKTDFHNEELGVGYRIGASTLVKVSYRQDLWHVDAGNAAFVRPGGRAFAVQLSQRFDLLGRSMR
jgi:hypothetical protein